MVPHIAAHKAHQRLQEFSISTPKRLLQHYLVKSGHRTFAARVLLVTPEPTLDFASHNTEKRHSRPARGGMAEVVTTMHHRGKAQLLTEQDRWKLYGIGRLSRAPSLNVR